MKRSWKEVYLDKVIEPKELSNWSEHIRQKGKTIVTLNGSFDLLHAGHLHMIYEAKCQADILIVALNSDSSIQAYKSKDRPIIELQYRMQMIAALGFVDFVTYFEELNPIELLKKIKPHVHVNGSEYGKNCIEAATVESLGGMVHIVELVPGLSTSAIIKKIKNETP